MADRTFSVAMTGDAKALLAAFAASRKGAMVTSTTVKGHMASMAAVTKKAILFTPLAFIAAGAGAVALGNKFKRAEHTIRRGTGATGKALNGLKKDFKEVVRDVPTDFGSAGTAIADINTRLGLTGKPLSKVSAQFLELSRITDTDLQGNIRTVSRLFKDWGVSNKQMQPTLDGIFRLSQATGVSIDSLAKNMVDFGSPLRQMGLDFDFSAAMFANFEKAGVATEKLMPGLRFALKNLSGATPKVTKELKSLGIATDDVEQGLKDSFKAIKEAGSAAEANQIAFKIFGVRAGPDMAAAIREGRFELDDLMEVFNEGKDTIRKVGKETESFGDKWDRLKNRVFVAMEPIATAAVEAVEGLMDNLGPHIDTVADKIADFAENDVPKIKTAFADARDWVEENWPGVTDSIKEHLDGVTNKVADDSPRWRDNIAESFDGIKKKVDENWPEIRETVQNAMDGIEEAVDKGTRAAKELWDRFGDHIMRFGELAWDNVGATAEAALGFLSGIIKFYSGVMQGDWGLMWDGIKKITSTAWNFLKRVSRNSAMGMWNSIKSVWEVIELGTRAIWEKIKGAVRRPINDIIGVINFFIGGVNQVLKVIPGLDTIKKVPRLGASAGTKVIQRSDDPARFAAGGRIGGGFMTKGPQAIVGEGRRAFPEFVIPTDPQFRGRALSLFGALGEQLLPRLGVGGVLGDALSKGKDFMGGLVKKGGGFVGDLSRKALTKIMGPVTDGALGKLGGISNALKMRDVASGVVRSVRDWVKGADSSLPDFDAMAAMGGGVAGGAGGAARWRGVALQALKMAGAPLSWIGSLLRRMNQESGGNPRAINLWDINAKRGDPSRGLMQTIGATFNAYAGHLRGRGIYDPLANIYAAIRYTIARYGSGPAGWNRPGGYAAGGLVGPNGGFTHPGELVLTRADQVGLLRVIRKGNGAAMVVHIHPGAIVIGADADARKGREAANAILDVIDERRVLTDARIS